MSPRRFRLQTTAWLSVAWRLPSLRLDPHGVQRGPRRDEQRPAVLPAEHQLNGPLGDFDGIDQLPGRVVHIDLPGRDEYVALGIDGHSLAALIGEDLEVRQAAIRA